MKDDYSKYPDVLGLKFTNNTEYKQYASLFQIFSENRGLLIEPIHSGYFSFNNLKNWLMKNKYDIELVRLQFQPYDKNKKILFRKFIFKTGNPFGSSMEMPMFVVGECFSPLQYQSGIVDVPVDAEFDGCSTDVMFEIYPNESFFITLFSKVKEQNKNKVEFEKGLTPFVGFPIVVENESDEPLTIDIFSEDNYRKLVEYDKNGKVYNLYEGEDSFGVKDNMVDDEKQYKEYGYICNLQRMKNKGLYRREGEGWNDGYDCIRLVNPNENEFTDIIVNGRTVRTNGYEEINQHLKITLDVRLDNQEKFDSFIVTIAPKSMMMYSFGNYQEIKEFKPRRLESGYGKK